MDKINGVNFYSVVPKTLTQVTNQQVAFRGDEKSKNSNTVKSLLGLGGLAALGIAAIMLHKSNAAKKAFQEGFNYTEPVIIKDTVASKNANKIIDKVEMLKRNEGSAYEFTKDSKFTYRDTGRYPTLDEMKKVDWDAKPISRTQALFEREFRGKDKLPYINPEFEKEFAELEKKGYKISVEDYRGGKKKITYMYPENSPIKSKTVIGKVADIEKGHTHDYDEKWVSLELRDASDVSSYHLTLRNNFKVGDGGLYEFGEYRKKFNGYGNTYGFIKPEDIFERGVTKFVKGGNRHDKETTELILKEFQKELGLS